MELTKEKTNEIISFKEELRSQIEPKIQALGSMIRDIVSYSAGNNPSKKMYHQAKVHTITKNTKAVTTHSFGCAQNLRMNNLFDNCSETIHFIERKYIEEVSKMAGFDVPSDYIQFWVDFCTELGFPMTLDCSDKTEYLIRLNHSDFKSNYHYFATFQLSRYIYSFSSGCQIPAICNKVVESGKKLDNYQIFIVATIIGSYVPFYNGTSKQDDEFNQATYTLNSTYNVFYASYLNLKRLDISNSWYYSSPCIGKITSSIKEVISSLSKNNSVNISFNGLLTAGLSNKTLSLVVQLMNALYYEGVESYEIFEKAFKKLAAGTVELDKVIIDILPYNICKNSYAPNDYVVIKLNPYIFIDLFEHNKV
jgi:hypothetical protein